MKLLVQLAMFVVFLQFFGIPAISRYYDMKVTVVSSVKDTDGIRAPAISVSALNAQTMNGWKGNISGHFDLLPSNVNMA